MFSKGMNGAEAKINQINNEKNMIQKKHVKKTLRI